MWAGWWYGLLREFARKRVSEYDKAVHLSGADWVKYQSLRGQEEDLRKRAEAMLEAADRLGELAASVLVQQ